MDFNCLWKQQINIKENAISFLEYCRIKRCHLQCLLGHFLQLENIEQFHSRMMKHLGHKISPWINLITFFLVFRLNVYFRVLLKGHFAISKVGEKEMKFTWINMPYVCNNKYIPWKLPDYRLCYIFFLEWNEKAETFMCYGLSGWQGYSISQWEVSKKHEWQSFVRFLILLQQFYLLPFNNYQDL